MKEFVEIGVRRFEDMPFPEFYWEKWNFWKLDNVSQKFKDEIENFLRLNLLLINLREGKRQNEAIYLYDYLPNDLEKLFIKIWGRSIELFEINIFLNLLEDKWLLKEENFQKDENFLLTTYKNLNLNRKIRNLLDKDLEILFFFKSLKTLEEVGMEKNNSYNFRIFVDSFFLKHNKEIKTFKEKYKIEKDYDRYFLSFIEKNILREILRNL